MCAAKRDVRFTPESDIKCDTGECPLWAISGHRDGLFDHLVCEREQKRRNLEAERLGSLEVEVEKELRWSHDRQDCRICAIENQSGVDPGLSISVRDIGTVAHQAPSFDELA